MSKVWNEFVKLASNWEKGKKDSDYNVIPEKDSEKTGNELTEKAHTKQVQVANSMMNDGIVENGVETQKEMNEIASIPPRGFVWNYSNFNAIAEVVPLLTKIANKLDEVGDDETVKLASDIDAFLGKVAQMSMPDGSVDPGPAQSQSNQEEAPQLSLNQPKERTEKPEVKMMDAKKFLDLTDSASSRLSDLDFSNANAAAKEDMEKLTAFLRKYKADFEAAQSGDAKVKLTTQYAAALSSVYDRIRNDIKVSESHWYSNAGKEALQLWDDLKLQADDWVANFGELYLKQAPKAPVSGPSVEKDLAKKEIPSGVSPTRQQYFKSPTVYALQKAMGFADRKNATPEQVKEDAIADSLFGPHTFGALEQLSKSNPQLAEVMKSAGPLSKWGENAVSRALSVLKPAEKTPAEVMAPRKDEVLEPYQTYEEGFKGKQMQLEQQWQNYFRKATPYLYMEIENGNMYPYGKENTEKNPRNFPSFPFRTDMVNMLLAQIGKK